MPSESAFKKQADAASDALKTFTAVRDSKSLIIVKAAIAELIDATVGFNNFVPFFVSHALFQEIPPAVFNVLEEFSNKNPKFDMPSAFAKVAGLDARVKDSIAVAKGKKGVSPFFFFFHFAHSFFRGRCPFFWSSCRQSWCHTQAENLYGKFCLLRFWLLLTVYRLNDPVSPKRLSTILTMTVIRLLSFPSLLLLFVPNLLRSPLLLMQSIRYVIHALFSFYTAFLTLFLGCYRRFGCHGHSRRHNRHLRPFSKTDTF
jgi:hypothetical protein